MIFGGRRREDAGSPGCEVVHGGPSSSWSSTGPRTLGVTEVLRHTLEQLTESATGDFADDCFFLPSSSLQSFVSVAATIRNAGKQRTLAVSSPYNTATTRILKPKHLNAS